MLEFKILKEGDWGRLVKRSGKRDFGCCLLDDKDSVEG